MECILNVPVYIFAVSDGAMIAVPCTWLYRMYYAMLCLSVWRMAFVKFRIAAEPRPQIDPIWPLLSYDCRMSTEIALPALRDAVCLSARQDYCPCRTILQPIQPIQPIASNERGPR